MIRGSMAMVTQTLPDRCVCVLELVDGCFQELVDGGIAVTLTLSLGLVLGGRVGVDALRVVVRLEDVLLCVGLVLSPGVSSNLLRLLESLLLVSRLLVGGSLGLLGLLEGLLVEGRLLLVGRLDRLLRGRLVVGLLPPGLLLLLLVGRGRSLLLNLLEVLEPALLLLLRSSSCWPGL